MHKVGPVFAEMSEMVGYPISPEYIRGEENPSEENPSEEAEEIISHFYYCRMGESGIAAAKIAAAKGYDIVYNLGYYKTITGYGYSAYLSDAVECAIEIGTGVHHYAKVNFFPSTVEEATAVGIDENSILDVTDLQYLCDEIPQFYPSYPFDGTFLDLEPTEEIKAAFPLWSNLTTEQKNTLIGLSFSKEIDYILPYAPQTNFYGGLETHFIGTFISEMSYYHEWDTSTITEEIVPGVAISSTGSKVDDLTPYLASEINSLWVGRKKFLFPVETSDLWEACANLLPDATSDAPVPPIIFWYHRYSDAPDYTVEITAISKGMIPIFNILNSTYSGYDNQQTYALNFQANNDNCTIALVQHFWGQSATAIDAWDTDGVWLDYVAKRLPDTANRIMMIDVEPPKKYPHTDPYDSDCLQCINNAVVDGKLGIAGSSGEQVLAIAFVEAQKKFQYALPDLRNIYPYTVPTTPGSLYTILPALGLRRINEATYPPTGDFSTISPNDVIGLRVSVDGHGSSYTPSAAKAVWPNRDKMYFPIHTAEAIAAIELGDFSLAQEEEVEMMASL
jgi:hypothetical protein